MLLQSLLPGYYFSQVSEGTERSCEKHYTIHIHFVVADAAFRGNDPQLHSDKYTALQKELEWIESTII